MKTNDVRSVSIFRLLLLAVLFCVAASLITTRWVLNADSWRHDEPDGHEWLADKLGLSEDEQSAIDVFDEDYRAQRNGLLIKYNLKKADLSGLLLTNKLYSQNVALAVNELHDLHGQIQDLAIRHYYDMHGALPPDKQDRLRELAAEALSEPR